MVVTGDDRDREASPLLEVPMAVDRMIAARAMAEAQRISDELAWSRGVLAESQRNHAHEISEAVDELRSTRRAMTAAASESARVKGLLILEINEREEREKRLARDLESCTIGLTESLEQSAYLSSSLADEKEAHALERERRRDAEELLEAICSSRSWRWSNALRRS